MTAWIQTYTGQKFEPLEPKFEQIHIGDIAHSLSLLCRFVGHCREFYSVAQHSIYVSQIVPNMPPDLALYGLLHDASEAYISDIGGPIKRYIVGYSEVEKRLMDAILQRYGLHPSLPREVKYADLTLLATEKRDLMSYCPYEWFPMPPPLANKIVPLAPKVVEDMFLRQFYTLGGDE